MVHGWWRPGRITTVYVVLCLTVLVAMALERAW